MQEADEAAQRLLKIEPENPQSWVTAAAAATRLLQQERALEAYEQAAALKPDEALIRLSIGHAQKTLGRRSDSEASYQAALAINPAMGAAYWSLADLKNYAFSDAEIATMQGLLRRELPREDAAQLHFALGKAFEHRREYPSARSNTTHRATRCAAWMPPSTSRTSSAAARASGLSSTPAFFAAHAGRRRPEPRAHLHRRPAALGLDAHRADPRQPFAR